MSFRLCIHILLLWLLGTGSIFAQLTPKRTSGPGNIGYLEYLPPNYDVNTSTKHPVYIFLHGVNERGDGSPADLEKIKSLVPIEHIVDGHDMCFTVAADTDCFVVIAPQLDPIYPGSWPDSLLKEVIDEILDGPNNHKIDKERVSLTGLSMGGFETWKYGTSLENFPNQLAAIAPVAASGDTLKGCVISKRKINTWAFHGERDSVVLFADALAMFNSVQNCTNPPPEAELIFTAYDRKHIIWNLSYSIDNSIHDPNLFEWFLTKTRIIDSLPPPNVPPVAMAGPDQNFQLPLDSVELLGSGSDADGAVIEVHWRQVGGPFPLTLCNIDTLLVAIKDLRDGTYQFELEVIDDNVVSNTDTVIVTFLPFPPLAPDSLLVVDEFYNLVDLTWNDNSSDEAGFEILRSLVPGGSYVVIDTAMADVTTYSDLGVNPLTSYYYVVRAFSNTGTSSVTNEVNANTPAIPPAPADPSDLTAVAISHYQIDLGWTDNSNNETSFEIHRSTTTMGPYSLIHTTDSNVVSYSDTQGILQSITYYYVIRGVNSGIPSNFTAEVAVTTPAAPIETDPIYINFNRGFAGGIPPPYYNSFSSTASQGLSLSNLLDDTNSGTGIDITLLTNWFKDHSKGMDLGDDSGFTPRLVMKTAYWFSTDQESILLTGLNQLQAYDLTFFASYNNATIRLTEYTTGGQTVSLEPALNTHNAVTIIDVIPDPNGEVVIDVKKGTGSPGGYINAMIIQPTFDGSNQPPTADAGLDRNIQLPQDTLTLSGTGTDTDGVIDSVQWIQLSGPSASILSGDTTLNVLLSALQQGVYTYQLKVTDDDGDSDRDTVGGNGSGRPQPTPDS